jgi:hypothetical protein
MIFHDFTRNDKKAWSRVSGEHRPLACSCRRLDGNIEDAFSTAAARCISASCRDEQASGLCSPDAAVAHAGLRREFASEMKEAATYLNDHLAGSVAALELLDHLIKVYQDKPLGNFFHELRADVKADQAVLQMLVQRFGKESAIRKAGAWIVEKFSRVKIKAAGEDVGEMGLLQALEALVLGITGKQLLWRALNASLGSSPLLRGADLAQLEERAIEQVERVEGKRLEAAREALLRNTR